MKAFVTMSVLGRLCPVTGMMLCVDEAVVCVAVDDAKKAGETSALSHMHATRAPCDAHNAHDTTHTSEERTP